jgi:serine/threonine protein kinase/ribosomal protein L37E
MGTVYLAHQESLSRDLAIKVLAPEFTRDPEFRERFQREARIAARLKHPNIVQVYDADMRDGFFYIAMEYVGDRNLHDLLDQAGGRLEPARACRITEQILSALAHAHSRKVIHRDIKPANVMIGADDHVSLVDFSIARAAEGGRLTRTGTMIGTPEYMAPEQFEGLEVDARTDLYAVGVMLYEMVTGLQPFRGDTVPSVMRAHLLKRPPEPTEVTPMLPPALSRVIMKALEKDPDNRYPDAESMREALLEASGLKQSSDHLNEFLAAILQGRLSMDEAVRAHNLVKEAIDREFRKEQTVMLIDLVGSTRLKVPGQTLHTDAIFRRYRSTVDEILEQHGCHSHDWSGDGALALFATAAEAVRAGLEVQGRLQELSRNTGGVELVARLGINTGTLYLDPRRSLGEFASLTVDQAGHLMKDCPPGEVLVSEATVLQAQEAALYEKLGTNRDGVVYYRARPLPQAPGSCPRCGRTLQPQVRFCPSCGLPLGVAATAQPEAPPTPSQVLCLRCGKPVQKAARFCTSCGSALEEPPREPSGQPAREALKEAPGEGGIQGTAQERLKEAEPAKEALGGKPGEPSREAPGEAPRGPVRERPGEAPRGPDRPAGEPCARCGKTIPAGSQFCSGCGAPRGGATPLRRGDSRPPEGGRQPVPVGDSGRAAGAARPSPAAGSGRQPAAGARSAAPDPGCFWLGWLWCAAALAWNVLAIPLVELHETLGAFLFMTGLAFMVGLGMVSPLLAYQHFRAGRWVLGLQASLATMLLWGYVFIFSLGILASILSGK